MRNQPPEEPKEDLRQRRTKKLLTEALLSLMEEQPFSEISVVDICQRAMVHRTTFYAHFEDKYALLRYAVARLYRAFEPTAEDLRANPRSYFLSVFQNALSFVRAHSGLYRSAVSSGSVDIQTLEDLVAEQLLSRFPADETNPALPGDYRPLLRRRYPGHCPVVAGTGRRPPRGGSAPADGPGGAVPGTLFPERLILLCPARKKA